MNKYRRAFTLVELLTVLTVGSSLMLVAVSLVHKTLQLSQAAKNKCERMQTLSRFADQFRRDVHAAESVEFESGERVTIRLGGNTAIYSVSEQTIAREFTADPRNLPDVSPSGREHLLLGRSSAARFELLAAPARVALTVVTQLEIPDAEPRVDRRIEVILPSH